jgi:hypothetical protein
MAACAEKQVSRQLRKTPHYQQFTETGRRRRTPNVKFVDTRKT